jgi:nitrate/TMAO reductase-like tetraheme cytochrome c subunit
VSDSDAQEPQQAARGRSRRRGWLAGFAVAVIVIVAAAILLTPVVATSSSSYCGSCHTMQQAYRSWQRGAHSSVPCSGCHVPVGVAASIKWRTKEARNIWATYLNMSPSAQRQPRPSSDNCLKCHPLKGLMGTPGKIRMPHATHITQNNLECVDCHDHTAHAPPGASDTVSMAVCTMCHQETLDPAKCTFCHYTPPAKGETHPTDFIAEHGQLALNNVQDCLRCHHNKAQFCDACHAKPTPGHYSADWPYVHGKQAIKNRAACLGCHSEKQLCDQCHTVNHPADWATAHAPVAAKGDRSCLVCHPRQMCVDCHAAQSVTVQAQGGTTP